MNKIRLTVCAFVLAITMFLVSCDRGKTISVDMEDGGKTFVVSVNDIIKINLPSNPSTGYMWVIMDFGEESDNNSSILKQIEDYKFTSNAGNNVVGADGISTITFKAISIGDTGISLIYVHPWEWENGELSTFSTENGLSSFRISVEVK